MLIQGDRKIYPQNLAASMENELTVIRNSECEGIYCALDLIPKSLHTLENYARGEKLYLLFANHSAERITDETLIRAGKRVLEVIYYAHSMGAKDQARIIRESIGIA